MIGSRSGHCLNVLGSDEKEQHIHQYLHMKIGNTIFKPLTIMTDFCSFFRLPYA